MQSKSTNIQKLAEKLIEAQNIRGRKFLLKDLADADFLELTKAVKEICYSYWTSEPTKAQTSAKVLQIIYKLSPQKEVQAYLEWVNGIAEITRGNLVLAIEKLERSSSNFLQLRNELEAAQTKVSKLYVLALLGRYDEAVECGRNTLKTFKNHKDDLSIGKILHNLGNLFFRREIYRQAEKYQLLAHKHFLKTKDIKQVTMIEHSLAVTYSTLNNFCEAERFYGKALAKAQKVGMIVTQAEIESSLGYLALFRGKLKEALKFLELSRRKYETLQMPHQTAIAALEIADVYLELNLTTEAVSIYEKIVDELHKLKLQGEEARARANFGRVAVSLNRTQTARKELKKAARLYLLEKNKVGAATVKLNEAHLELSLQNNQKALELAQEAENLLKKSENLRHLLTSQWLQAEALRNLGENVKAQKRLSQIFIESIKKEQPNTAQLAQISLGKLAVQQKDFRRAEKHFKRAIKLIETLRAPLAAEEFRMAFLANKLEPFECLTKIYLAENKIKNALLMIERARSRSLSESLDEKFTTKNLKASKALQNKLDNLREELNWFYSRLNRAGESEIKNLQAEAGKREKQIADVMRQIESTASNSTETNLNFGGHPATRESENLGNLQKRLGERQALIEFVNLDGVLAAFVITDKKIHFIDNLVKESGVLSLLESLQFQFGALRYGAKNLGNFIDELKKRADFYLRRLYEKLFAPLEKFVGKRDLVIVPVGATHYVPFHALFDGKHYLIEKREIVHAPSATVWQFLASKRQKKSDNALLIGYADERIPLVNREIESLQKIFCNAESYTGEQANVAAFMANAPRFDVLHLACHGQFRPESPMFSSLHLADGWLTVRDISSLKLKAELVTLSACETGLNKIFAGEEVLGLARGFLSAGAKSLLLSLWTVSDEATTELMQTFYEQRQTGKSAAKSLQIAQKSFIERGVHPHFWSPFLLIGK